MPSVQGVVLFYCMFLFYIRHVAHAYDHFFNKEFMDESEICSCTSFLWSKNVAQLNKINLAHKVNAINLVRDFIYAKYKLCGGKEGICVCTKYNDHNK